MSLSEDLYSPPARLVIIGLICGAAVLMILARVVTLMIISGEYYRGLATGNRTREVVKVANRGIIYDRNGQPLVQNLPTYVVGGKVISKEEALVFGNAEISPTRSYLYGPVFAHVLGYMNVTDQVGVTGIEEAYNLRLVGTNGKELVETEANGEKLRILGSLEPISGENIKTTLDLRLQRVLYEALKNFSGAVAVATNPKTGEILALVSVPSFDPQKVEESLNKEGKPFFDRAISGTYPPGSTFKIVTATAGLESGAINRNTLLEDTGVLIIGPYKFANWKYLRNGGVDGWINVVEAIQQSNDLFFYQVGGKVGIEKLTETAKIFGLGKPLGIDLAGEVGGLIKQEREWYLGDTYHLAIGQGDLLVTPLQVNAWTGVIANSGKLCRPHLNYQLPITNYQCKDLGFKKETIELVKEGMREACDTGGTAWPLFGLKMYCKTGTAEFGDPKNRTHAWLTGFIEGDRPLVITVLVEGGGEGSDVAAPVVKKAVEEWLKEE